MTNSNGAGKDDGRKDDKAKVGRRQKQPQWADGLKRLYDSVVDEPLPDDLAALLARLDGDNPA